MNHPISSHPVAKSTVLPSRAGFFLYLTSVAILFAGEVSAQPATGHPANWLITPDIIRGVGADENGNYVVGDMVFSEHSLKAMGADPRGLGAGNRWPSGDVFYSFDSTVSDFQRQTFRDAAQWWADIAGVRFYESNTAGSRIHVKIPESDTVCNSYVGRIGGVQEMNLGFLCWSVETVAHEVGHALGLLHEQNRSDRAPYVTIVSTGGGTTACDSLIAVNWGIRPGSLLTNYDFGSIMHYPSFGRVISDGCPAGVTGTITATSAQPGGAPAGSETICQSPEECTLIMGNGHLLSARDAWSMALRYGYRVKVLISGDGDGSISASGHQDGCGSYCYLVIPQATFNLSAIPAESSVARISAGSCFNDSVCQFSPVGNSEINVRFIKKSSLHAASIAATMLVMDEVDPIFADGFELVEMRQ